MKREICFIGVDGAGKTTFSTLLYYFLKKRGYVVKVIKVTNIMKPFNVIINKHKKTERYIKNEDRSILFSILICMIIFIFELLVLVLVRCVLLRKKVIIIFDRFFYYLFYEFIRDNVLSYKLANTLIDPYLVVLIYINPNIISKRLHQKHDKEKPIKYFKKMTEWFLQLAYNKNFIIVNNTEKRAFNTFLNLLGFA